MQSINERMPYLDNLLAGSLPKHGFAKKDQHLFESKPRENGNKDINYCNNRHSYNGTLR